MNAPVLDPDILSAAAELTRDGTAHVLATVVRAVAPTSARAGDKALLTADGLVRGWVGGSCAEPIVRDEAERALKDGAPRLVRITPDVDSVLERAGLVVHRMTCFSGGELDIYVEPHLPVPRLVVYGTSPVARAMAELGALMRYEVIAATSASVPVAPSNRPTYVVVATHGVFDDEALDAAVGLRPSYLGLVASLRRRQAVLQALRGRGAPAELVQSIVAPAGLDLGATTPEEIAVTIAAQLVAVRRGQVITLQRAAASQQSPATLVAAPPALVEEAPAVKKACCHAKHA